MITSIIEVGKLQDTLRLDIVCTCGKTFYDVCKVCMAACSPASAFRRKMGVGRVGFMHPRGVVDGPGEPIKDIPNQHTDPPAGRVC